MRNKLLQFALEPEKKLIVPLDLERVRNDPQIHLALVVAQAKRLRGVGRSLRARGNYVLEMFFDRHGACMLFAVRNVPRRRFAINCPDRF